MRANYPAAAKRVPRLRANRWFAIVSDRFGTVLSILPWRDACRFRSSFNQTCHTDRCTLHEIILPKFRPAGRQRKAGAL